MFQAFWVFTVSLPGIFVNAPTTAAKDVPLMTAADIVGVVLWGIGILIETIADFQKFFFKNNPDNKGKWCDVGEEYS